MMHDTCACSCARTSSRSCLRRRASPFSRYALVVRSWLMRAAIRSNVIETPRTTDAPGDVSSGEARHQDGQERARGFGRGQHGAAAGGPPVSQISTGLLDGVSSSEHVEKHSHASTRINTTGGPATCPRTRRCRLRTPMRRRRRHGSSRMAAGRDKWKWTEGTGTGRVYVWKERSERKRCVYV